MNKSNVGASLDTIHFLIDITMLIFSFIVTVVCFRNSLTDEQIFVLFLLCLIYGIIYLLTWQQNIDNFYLQTRKKMI